LRIETKLGEIKMKRLMIIFILVAISLAACTSTPAEPLVVTGAWARPALAGQNSAIYLTIENPNNFADNLVQASSEAAESTELHMSQMDEQGVMSMHPQHAIEVPKNGQVALASGGLHVMLVNLKQDLTPGDLVSLVLQFDKSGEMLLQVPVQDAP
jgi:hypothetical protein